MKTVITILFCFIFTISFSQENEIINGYGEIFLGESKKTLLKKIGNNFSQKKIDGNKYIYYKNLEISLDDYDVIEEISIKIDSNIKLNNIVISNETKVKDIIDFFGNEWGYYEKNPVNIDFDNGISFETNYILDDVTSKDLSVNQNFLNSKITSLVISESEINSDETFKNYEYIEGVYIPKNLDETFTELSKLINAKNKSNFLKNDEKEFLSSQHFGLGKYIRNEWGLWKKSRLYLWFKEKGITHPDDISAIILKHYYRKNNKNEFSLENEIIYYQEYWNKN